MESSFIERNSECVLIDFAVHCFVKYFVLEYFEVLLVERSQVLSGTVLFAVRSGTQLYVGAARSHPAASPACVVCRRR